MSKRMMANTSFSKFKQLSFAFTFTLMVLFTLSKHTSNQNIQAQLLSSCMTTESSLPLSHINHPCYTRDTSNMSSNSWISWLSGDSKSTHLHFLDLVELIHHSFY